MTLRRKKKDFPQNRIFLGKLTKPHALSGEMKLQTFGCDPWLLEELGVVHVEGKNLFLEVEYVRGCDDAPIVKFKSVDDRNQSDELVGSVLWIEPDKLPELDENEYYESDFLYSRVVTVDGVDLGRVDQIIETGAADVLVVRNAQGQERMIPARLESIVEIRREESTIVVRLLDEEPEE